eukprot:Clim_evm4s89 gene=Clim_evmTU4s89
MKTFIVIALGTISGIATASPVATFADECKGQNEPCQTGAECCNYTAACSMAHDGPVGTCHDFGDALGLRRMNAPCEHDGECWSAVCTNNHCAPRSNGWDNGASCTYDYDCKGGWCKASPGQNGVCADRSGNYIDPPKW